MATFHCTDNGLRLKVDFPKKCPCCGYELPPPVIREFKTDAEWLLNMEYECEKCGIYGPPRDIVFTDMWSGFGRLCGNKECHHVT